MESRILQLILPLLLLDMVVSHAALPSVVYWNKVLTNTHMPSAIRVLLQPAGANTVKHGTSNHVDKAKLNSVNPSRSNLYQYPSDVAQQKSGGGGAAVASSFAKYQYPAAVAQEKSGGGGTPAFEDQVRFASYDPDASQDQVRAARKVTLFFLEKDLHQGTKMNLHFTRTTDGARLLPRQVAEAIPFTSNQMSEVMHKFSVNPQSTEAEAMMETVKLCEAPAQKGEQRSCTTSLESMIDFSVSKLGKHAQPMSTEVDKKEMPLQQYTIAAGVKQMGGESSVACHRQPYAYAVFYCHVTHSTKAYKVPLVGVDGTKAAAVAVCHTDTSKWNPKHLAFQLLKVKPGSVPVCHFIPLIDVVWISN